MEKSTIWVVQACGIYVVGRPDKDMFLIQDKKRIFIELLGGGKKDDEHYILKVCTLPMIYTHTERVSKTDEICLYCLTKNNLDASGSIKLQKPFW